MAKGGGIPWGSCTGRCGKDLLLWTLWPGLMAINYVDTLCGFPEVLLEGIISLTVSIKGDMGRA